MITTQSFEVVHDRGSWVWAVQAVERLGRRQIRVEIFSVTSSTNRGKKLCTDLAQKLNDALSETWRRA